MSLTVSPAIPLRRGDRSTIRVVSSTKEDRVVLLVQIGGITTDITLDNSAARALRARLAKPAK